MYAKPSPPKPPKQTKTDWKLKRVGAGVTPWEPSSSPMEDFSALPAGNTPTPTTPVPLLRPLDNDSRSGSSSPTPTPAGLGEVYSRTSSLNGSFDSSQSRFIHGVFKTSFGNENLIKEKPTNVVIHGVNFLIVERVITGPSDALYAKSKKIWEHVPRGQAKVFFNRNTTPLNSFPSTPIMRGEPSLVSPTSAASLKSNYKLVASLNGLRKFAHWGETTANVYNVGKEIPVEAVAVEKIDGESAQLCAFSFDEQRYWLIGPRDRHILVRLDVPEEDVNAYFDFPTEKKSRTCTHLAKKIAVVWKGLLERLEPEKREALHEHIAKKEWTLCFDAVLAGWEHLVDYTDDIEPLTATDAGDLPHCGTSVFEEEETDASDDSLSDVARYFRDKLFFYAITTDTPAENGGLCLPVQEAMEFFDRFSLPHPPFTQSMEINSDEFLCLRDTIGGRLNSAGVVFYGVGTGCTSIVRLWKCRSDPHSMEHTAQESITALLMSGTLLLSKLQKKLSNLNRVVRPHTLVWEKERLPFLIDFANWLHATRQLTPSADSTALQHIRANWISLQIQFSCEYNSETCGSGSSAEEEEEEEVPLSTEVILLIGPQGCGKSTVARALFALLEEAGGTPRWINQDETKDRRSFFSTLRRLLDSGQYTHVIVDRMNLNSASRADYKELSVKVTLAIVWSHPQGEESLIDFCFERVKQRGTRHKTFKVSTEGNNVESELRKIKDIISKNVKSFEPPDVESTLQLDVTLNCSALLQRCWEKLRDTGVYNLPDITELSLSNASDVAFKYELLFDSYINRITSAVLEADDSCLQDIQERLPMELLTGHDKKLSPAVQVVLHNFLDHPNPSALVHYASLEGEKVTVTLTRVVSDAKATIVFLHDPCNTRTYPRSVGATSLALESNRQRLLYSILSRGKKITNKYCRQLAERAVFSKEIDPYWTVIELPKGATATFTYTIHTN
ncbi:hypothetical protein AGDE_14021 [Angomonas deanei]|uniref:tRNA ligase kinase domain containing protein, putative n=1 Tax=Angomonas deanei TaxID=59799 RepID=A0A7G2CIA2_9TRYP|nr:hypothetical protein AGDE_14021 [Angomonas deanei]CAD2219139.1 tRNA ligase kinase domain containing protein, putative [Angomonas deanei]|eukprot:EPY21544.1 hypothetical protein AGDE_14021 [Angomonas deanei]